MILCHLLSGIIRQLFHHIISIAVPLLVYTVVLIVDVPKEIGLAARYGFTTVLIPVALLFYPVYRCSGWKGTSASLSLTLVLFALPLSALWNSGMSDPSIVGGLLPWSDASGYYWDAKRLLEGAQFSAFSSRRPLFAGILATLLGLTQQNLQITLAVLVATTAISCFILAQEIQHSYGTEAGILVIAILFLFYRRFVGTTLTENLGLSVGAVSFALLWRGARQRQINLSLVGILLLTLALIARAGAFFTLPAIILRSAWSFPKLTRFPRRLLIGGASAVLFGFILNSVLLKTIGSPNGMAFSNFSYVLYGLIVGGNWTQVVVDHPELKSLSDPDLSKRVYALALEAFRANPFGIINGFLKAWKQFLLEDYAFSFISNIRLNISLQILTIIGLYSCYRQRKNNNSPLVMAILLGILISVPFVPPWDADHMRAYAATIPILAILPAIGLAFIIRKNRRRQLINTQSQDKQSTFHLSFGIILALFISVAPFVTKVLNQPPQFADVICPVGTTSAYVRINTGALINLVADSSRRKTYLPNVRLSDFRNGLARSDLPPETMKELTLLNPSTTIINALNLRNLSQMWLIAATNMIQKESGIVGVCGKLSMNSSSQAYGFFYANSVRSVAVINSSH